MILAARSSEATIGGMPEVRLEWHMDNWRRFMRSDCPVDGFPGRSMVLAGAAISATFDELVDSVDKRCAMAVDAIIRGLTPAESAAVDYAYLHAVWRFPRDNYLDLLKSGRMKIARGLVSRGFY